MRALSLAWSWAKIRITGLNTVAGGGVEEIDTLTDAAPDERHVLGANWRQGAWTLQARATRQGSTTRVFDFGGGFTPTQAYEARWQFDLDAEWRFALGLSVAVGAVKLGDTYPTRAIGDSSYFGNLPYDVLSPIGFNGALHSARVQCVF